MRITIIAIAVLLGACSETKKSFDESFRVSFQKSFVESCTTEAMKSGAAADMKPYVTDLCTCTAQGLVAKFTPTQLTTLIGGGNKDEIEKVAQECARRSLPDAREAAR